MCFRILPCAFIVLVLSVASATALAETDRSGRTAGAATEALADATPPPIAGPAPGLTPTPTRAPSPTDTANAPAAAPDSLHSILFGAETVRNWRRKLDALTETGEAHARAGREAEALAAHRHAGRLLSRHRDRLSAEDALALARPVQTRLADLLLRASDLAAPESAETTPADAGESDQALLREAIEALEDLKVGELREYFGDACLSNLETATPDAMPDTTLLYPVLLADRVELIVGREGRLTRTRSPVDPATLTKAIRRFRRDLQDPTTPRYRRSGAALYDALIRPLQWDRPTSDASTLTFVPMGALRGVPAAAFYNSQTKRFLIEEFAIATLPTLRIAPAQPIDPRRTRMLAAGLTEAGEGVETLPAIARELEAASAHFTTTRRTGLAFSRAGLAEALMEAPFDVIHLSTHGRFDAEASQSYLDLRDGRLELSEFAEMIAATRHRTSRPLELLTLSACETALGDDRAVLGLAGVAVQSGARSAIATLWRVNDDATATLFEAFYEAFARDGQPRTQALQAAQRRLLESRAHRHPIFWSAFLLIQGGA